MGFFKDFKEDLSQAVNELMPDEEAAKAAAGNRDMVVNTLEDEVDVESELSKLDGLLEQVMKQEQSKEPIHPAPIPAVKPVPEVHSEPPIRHEPVVPSQIKREEPVRIPEPEEPSHIIVPELPKEEKTEKKEKKEKIEKKEAQREPEKQIEEQEPAKAEQNTTNQKQEEKKMADVTPNVNAETPVSDEVTVITEGTVIKGDISSNGSLDIRGHVQGNVGCQGKLTVTGNVTGNSNASEFFADTAKVQGEVVSSGTVKIGLGSVIIGNVTSSSAVIAGAIKGDIDVQGPVVVDTSAVVMGNIKSRSVQINNGAVIEGFCSQCYSDVNVESLFAEEGKEQESEPEQAQ